MSEQSFPYGESPSRRRWLLTSAILAASGASAAVVIKLPQDLPARLTPRAAGARMLGAAKAGEAHVCVGPRGYVLRSVDGRQWRQQPCPVSSDLTGVQFVNGTVGWAVGHDGVVLKTQDGGGGWTKVMDGSSYGPPMVKHYESLMTTAPASQQEALGHALDQAQRMAKEGADKPFLGLCFENEQSGWLFGAFNLILHTGDGGQTWQPWFEKSANAEGYHIYGMAAAGEDVYLVGELGMARRFDKTTGAFAPITSPYPGSLFGVAAKAGHVVAYGLRGHAYISKDSGKTWALLPTGSKSTFTGGRFLEGGSLALTTSRGELLLSADNGASFHSVRIGAQTGGVNDVVGAGKGEVVLATDRGPFKVVLS